MKLIDSGIKTTIRTSVGNVNDKETTVSFQTELLPKKERSGNTLLK